MNASGANTVDYEALRAVKAKINTKFDEILANLKKAKSDMDTLNQETWTGASGQVFNNVFTEIEAKINAERNRFNEILDRQLETWYNEFTEAEQQQIQAANNM